MHIYYPNSKKTDSTKDPIWTNRLEDYCLAFYDCGPWVRASIYIEVHKPITRLGA